MGTIAAIGEDARLRGYALAGAALYPVASSEQLAAAWDGLPRDVSCLLLTEAAHAALASRLHERPELVWTVLAD